MTADRSAPTGQREWRTGRSPLLVGPLLAASDDSSTVAVWPELLAWAESRGFEVWRLPEPGHWAHPEADAAHRRRLARADRAALVRALAQLRAHVGPGRSPIATVIAVEEAAGQSGRAWSQRVREAAENAQVPLMRPVRISVDERLDIAYLDRVILGLL